MLKYPLLVVSDFDGTISTEDLVVLLTTAFAPGNQDLVDAINRQEISLGEGLAALFRALPTGQEALYRRFIHNHSGTRPGFDAFAANLANANIPLFIASNGLDMILHMVLEGRVPADHIYANHADLSGTTIEVQWTYPCPPDDPHGCGLCKPSLIEALRRQFGAPVVFVGDGVTDFLGAEAADYVIARSRLAEWLQQQSQPFRFFEDFYQVDQHVKDILREVSSR
ncbi:MAG: HAD-IB family phosphatase [Sulfobacillus sp.]